MAQLVAPQFHIVWMIDYIDLWWFNQRSQIKTIETNKENSYSFYFESMILFMNHKALFCIKQHNVQLGLVSLPKFKRLFLVIIIKK